MTTTSPKQYPKLNELHIPATVRHLETRGIIRHFTSINHVNIKQCEINQTLFQIPIKNNFIAIS